MSSKVFGTRADGVLTLCRALPENRGVGNCPHSSHVDISDEQLKAGFLTKFNEEVISRSGVTAFPVLVKKSNSKSSNERKKRSAAALAKLLTEAAELEKSLSHEDFNLVKSVYGDFARLYEDELLLDKSVAMENYLTSNEPTAMKLREYLGSDTDYAALSDMLVNEVGGMTSAHRWSTSGRHSISRVFLTALNNDMDRENYVTSVLYFKGKCCYCQKTLGRNAGGKIALPTGEHITPITPSRTGSPVGGTRFGNVALACNRCNKSRSNEDLHIWLKQESAPVADSVRSEALARISAFRKFSGYADYTTEQTALIREAAALIQVNVDSIRGETGKIVRGTGAGDIIREQIATKLSQLKRMIPAK